MSFIVFTSNVFAILGLRALYFLLAGIMQMFRYLHYGLAGVLAFIGLNMIGDYVAVTFFAQPAAAHVIPTWAKLLVIAVLLAVSIVASIVVKRKESP